MISRKLAKSPVASNAFQTARHLDMNHEQTLKYMVAMLDEDGFVQECDDEKANELIQLAITAL